MLSGRIEGDFRFVAFVPKVVYTNLFICVVIIIIICCCCCFLFSATLNSFLSIDTGHILYILKTVISNSMMGGTRRSSVVRAFAHGAMGRRIDPSCGGPTELFIVPPSAPRLV